MNTIAFIAFLLGINTTGPANIPATGTPEEQKAKPAREVTVNGTPAGKPKSLGGGGSDMN